MADEMDGPKMPGCIIAALIALMWIGMISGCFVGMRNIKFFTAP
jgi:hypothetical protein